MNKPNNITPSVGPTCAVVRGWSFPIVTRRPLPSRPIEEWSYGGSVIFSGKFMNSDDGYCFCRDRSYYVSRRHRVTGERVMEAVTPPDYEDYLDDDFFESRRVFL